MEKEKAIAADQWSWGSLRFKWYFWLVGVGNFINLKHSKHLHSRIVPCWHVPCVQDRHLHFALCIDAIDSYVYAEVILKVYHVGMKLDGCRFLFSNRPLKEREAQWGCCTTRNWSHLSSLAHWVFRVPGKAKVVGSSSVSNVFLFVFLSLGNWDKISHVQLRGRAGRYPKPPPQPWEILRSSPRILHPFSGTQLRTSRAEPS